MDMISDQGCTPAVETPALQGEELERSTVEGGACDAAEARE
jgi:hypothetical protein